MKFIKIFLILTVTFLFWKLTSNNIFASEPHLFLSPYSGNYSQNFNVELKVDTGGEAVGGVDVYLEFPKNLLKIEKITKGTAFSEVFYLIKNEEGKLRLTGYFPYTEAEKSYNGSNGLIATINFSPLDKGNAEVNFICSPDSTTASNIVKKTETKDIIVCSANINGSYVLGGENPQPTSQSTPTPAQSSTPTPTPLSRNTLTPTPTLPVTGSTFQTVGVFGLGIFSLLTGLIFMF